MFNAAQYRRMYDRFMGPLAQPVTLLVNNGTGFDSYPDVMAHVSRYRETDMVDGGPVKLGDLRLIVLAENLPVSELELKDRVEIDGRAYGVLRWDAETRSVGDETIAIEAQLRG